MPDPYNVRRSISLGCIAALFICISILASLVSYGVGHFAGERNIYGNVSETKAARLTRMIRNEPERFSNVKVGVDNHGGAQVYGLVQSQDDFEVLETKVFEAFGEVDGPTMIIVRIDAGPMTKPTEPKRRYPPPE